MPLNDRPDDASLNIGAVVLNYRHARGVGEVVSALRRQTLPPKAIVVVDNGSGSDQVDVLRGLGEVQVLALGSNRGYAAGMNAGFDHLVTSNRVDAVLFLTHDCLLETEALSRLEELLRLDHSAGVTAPALGWSGRPDVLWSLGGDLRRLTGRPYHLGQGDPVTGAQTRPPRGVLWADGAALLVRADAFVQAKRFSEDYFLYFEEVDFAARLRRLGWRVLVVGDALAWQAPGRTAPYLATRNQLVLVSRHRRWSLPFALAHALIEVARQMWRYGQGRVPWKSATVVMFGVVDGLTGRFQPELVTYHHPDSAHDPRRGRRWRTRRRS